MSDLDGRKPREYEGQEIWPRGQMEVETRKVMVGDRHLWEQCGRVGDGRRRGKREVGGLCWEPERD